MTAPVQQEQTQLDQQYRVELNTAAAGVAALLASQWIGIVNPLQIAASTAAWLPTALAAIENGREETFGITQSYLEASRRLQIPRERPWTIIPPPPPNREQLLTSLAVTGPVRLQQLLNQIPNVPTLEEQLLGHAVPDVAYLHRAEKQVEEMQAEAIRASAASLAGAAYRHTQAGARDTIDTAFTQDKRVQAWIRVLGPKPCAFCLMLASRGPVYRGGSFDRSDVRFNGPGDWKVHDNCACTGRLIYDGKVADKLTWTPQSRAADELWVSSGASRKSGKAARNLFAKAAREAGMADLNRY